MSVPAKSKSSKPRPDPSSMTFLEHLDELRTRIIASLKALVLVGAVCGWFYQPITQFFLGFAPQRVVYVAVDDSGVERTITTKEYERLVAEGSDRIHRRLERSQIAIAPAEPFLAALKSVVVVTVVICSPWLLLQLWLFVAPGLYAHEKRYVVPFVASGTLFFIAGLAFACYVAIPLSTRVLYGMDIGGAVAVQWTAERTLSFVLRMFLAFGIAFEMPVVVFVLAALGIVSPRTLARQRPYVVVGIFVLSAILTPPDYISQLILAGPLWFLFEASVLAARIFVSRRQAREVTEADDPYAD